MSNFNIQDRLVRFGELIPCKTAFIDAHTPGSNLKENEKEIDAAIKRVVPECQLSYNERRLWILNDEGLYNWARSEGVRI